MTEVEAMARFLAGELPPAMKGAVRAIAAGDEGLLRPDEARGLTNAVAAVRQASGAGRDLARELCRQVGIEVEAIPRGADRAPVWPPGIVGSIAHDRGFAAAIVTSAPGYGGVGIDIEPVEPLEDGVVRLIGSAGEVAQFTALAAGDKLLFSIKEAVYKAVYPRDQRFLEFHDVVVDAASGTAVTAYGRTVRWRVLPSPHIIAVAWW